MKRGQSGYSFIVGINKKAGKSSHSSLNYLKKTLGESRIGHAGTLDPFAQGVLIALVGPAARLNQYISCDDKSYLADITFGKTTLTDDIDGEVINVFDIPCVINDENYAKQILDQFTGNLLQKPPIYSAIKQEGRKACDEARKGNIVNLKPREITVLKAELQSIDYPTWNVNFDVSKGTYIRALARDIGKATGCGAFLSSLIRTKSGRVTLDMCVDEDSSLDVLFNNSLDPIRLLRYPLFFIDSNLEKAVNNGNFISANEVELHKYIGSDSIDDNCCTSSLTKLNRPLVNGELICALNNVGLKAIYKYDESLQLFRPDCVFTKEVVRGVN